MVAAPEGVSEEEAAPRSDGPLVPGDASFVGVSDFVDGVDIAFSGGVSPPAAVIARWEWSVQAGVGGYVLTVTLSDGPQSNHMSSISSGVTSSSGAA